MTFATDHLCSIPLRTNAQFKGSVFARAHHLWTSRRALARLTATQLKDVGLSRSDAEKEARRPIWDAPEHWHR